jgi:hypothetical protein
VKEGERELRRRFDVLFEAHSSDVVAYCDWRTGSLSEAKEAVAEVFLTAWRRLDDVPRGDAAGVAVRDRAEGDREPAPINAPSRCWLWKAAWGRSWVRVRLGPSLVVDPPTCSGGAARRPHTVMTTFPLACPSPR